MHRRGPSLKYRSRLFGCDDRHVQPVLREGLAILGERSFHGEAILLGVDVSSLEKPNLLQARDQAQVRQQSLDALGQVWPLTVFEKIVGTDGSSLSFGPLAFFLKL